MTHLEATESFEFPLSESRPTDSASSTPSGAWCPRASKLRAWIDRQVELEDTSVSIPNRNLKLSIYHPTAASRSALFAQAKASPDRQMPHWANIWPSGLALASVALRHPERLAGKRVLELGSGLGSTAAATLMAGASVLALDYSPLALGLCRYNALMNAGTSPRTLPLNWRDMRRQNEIRLAAAGPFPIIMAADVLYESRDIDPLINLINRYLAPGGSSGFPNQNARWRHASWTRWRCVAGVSRLNRWSARIPKTAWRRSTCIFCDVNSSPTGPTAR